MLRRSAIALTGICFLLAACAPMPPVGKGSAQRGIQTSGNVSIPTSDTVAVAPNQNWKTIFGPFALDPSALNISSVKFACRDDKTGEGYSGRVSFIIKRVNGYWNTEAYGDHTGKTRVRAVAFEGSGAFTISVFTEAACVLTLEAPQQLAL